MKRVLVWGWLLLSLAATHRAHAVIPETGMWWNSLDPGRGYYIDVQGNTVFFIAYAYDNDGSPSFVAGSGTLQTRSGEVLGFGFPVFSALGYEPWHFVAVDLFRFEGGGCFTCTPRPATGTRIGAVGLYFDNVSRAYAYFQFADGSFDYRTITRFNYAYAPYAQASDGSAPRVPDLRGDWVFVDTIDRSVPAWRFNFTRVEQSVPNIIRTTPPPWTVTFFDDARNARFFCRQEAGGLFPTARNSGCQLFINEVPIFWARIQDDLGLDRIQAGYGAVPSVSEAYRGPGIILGQRVE